MLDKPLEGCDSQVGFRVWDLGSGVASLTLPLVSRDGGMGYNYNYDY